MNLGIGTFNDHLNNSCIFAQNRRLGGEWGNHPVVSMDSLLDLDNKRAGSEIGMNPFQRLEKMFQLFDGDVPNLTHKITLILALKA